MAVLEESRGDENVRWRRGTLSNEEFDHAAAVFRPSWEQGLEVARRASLAPPAPIERPSAPVAFSAPSGAVLGVLADSSGISSAPPARTPVIALAVEVPSVVVTDAEPVPEVAPPVQVVAPAAKPVQASAAVTERPPAVSPRTRVISLSEVPLPAPPRSRALLYAGAVLVVASIIGISAAVLGGSHTETPAEPTQAAATETPVAAPVAQPTPVPAANPAPPAPVEPPAIAAAPAMEAQPPVPAPAVVAVAPAPPAIVAPVAPPAPVVVPHPVRPVVAMQSPVTPPAVPHVHTPRVAGGAPSRGAHATGVHTAGFVSDNPY